MLCVRISLIAPNPTLPRFTRLGHYQCYKHILLELTMLSQWLRIGLGQIVSCGRRLARIGLTPTGAEQETRACP
jgi:hypothetical protein